MGAPFNIDFSPGHQSWDILDSAVRVSTDQNGATRDCTDLYCTAWSDHAHEVLVLALLDRFCDLLALLLQALAPSQSIRRRLHGSLAHKVAIVTHEALWRLLRRGETAVPSMPLQSTLCVLEQLAVAELHR